MGLVNDVSVIVENERVSKSVSMFDGYSEVDKVYCITNTDYNRLYAVLESYAAATIVQKTYKHNTAIWYTTVQKASEHFSKCQAEKNRKKERKEEEKLIDLSKVEKIASTEQTTGLLASYTTQAIGIQLGKQRFRKKIMNGEKNIKYFPFNGSLQQDEKEWYFKTFLQCPGFVSL